MPSHTDRPSRTRHWAPVDADLRGYGAGGRPRVTAFVQNCSLLSCEEIGKVAVVDPGGEVDRILGVAAEAGVKIEKVLLTHGHIDPVAGTAELAGRLGVPIEGPHQDDRF